MDNCCGGRVREETFGNMLQSIVDSKVINVELLTVAVGVLFLVLLSKFRSFSGT